MVIHWVNAFVLKLHFYAVARVLVQQESYKLPLFVMQVIAKHFPSLNSFICQEQQQEQYMLLGHSCSGQLLQMIHSEPRCCRNWLFLLLNSADRDNEFGSVQTALVVRIPETPRIAESASLEVFVCRHGTSTSCNSNLSALESEWVSGIVTDICLWVWKQMLV